MVGEVSLSEWGEALVPCEVGEEVDWLEDGVGDELGDV